MYMDFSSHQWLEIKDHFSSQDSELVLTLALKSLIIFGEKIMDQEKF